MDENKKAEGPKWILIGTGVIGLIAAGLLVVVRYYEINKARAEADHAHVAAERARADSTRTEAPSNSPPPPPMASRAVVNPIPQTNEVTVTPLGMGGTYHSIADAVRNAPPESVIKIRPGIYRQPLVLTKDVAIEGDGKRGEILIETDDVVALTVTGGRVTLRRLTISANSSNVTNRRVAVLLQSGKLSMNECEVRASRAAAFHVSGPDAVANITRCTINGRGGHTFGVANGALATLEDSFLANKLGSAVLVQSGAKVVVRRCNLTKSEVGLRALKEGVASIEDSDLTGNASSAFDVKPGAKVERLNNKE